TYGPAGGWHIHCTGDSWVPGKQDRWRQAMNVWGWFLIILGFWFVVGQLIAILRRNRRAQTPGQFVLGPPPIYRPLQYEIDGKLYSPVQAEAVWAAMGRYPLGWRVSRKGADRAALAR